MSFVFANGSLGDYESPCVNEKAFLSAQKQLSKMKNLLLSQWFTLDTRLISPHDMQVPFVFLN